jgi:glycosyltransferase (activator-dependent family)
MRILFLAPPALKSHLFILTPLAWALRNAGHEVRVACQPDLADGIRQAGLTGVLFGQDMTEALAEIDEAEPVAEAAARRPDQPAPMPPQTDYAKDDPYAELDYLTWNLLQPLCSEPAMDELVEFARAWRPDLVLWDSLTYAGAVAAKASGAAHGRVLFGADAFLQLREAARRQQPDRDPMRDWLQRTIQRYGGEFTEDLVTGQWTVDTMPPWTWRPAGRRYLLMRHLSFNGSSIVPPWLYQQPPARRRVCLTLGSSHRDTSVTEASTASLLQAVAELDVEVVATFTAEQLGSVRQVPANVRVVDFVPLNALLPSCAAVVHHGGAGAAAAAFEHGVPQLIVPTSHWSEKWFGPLALANGIEEQGAGLYVAESAELTAPVLAERLARVLKEPSFTTHARRLRSELLAVPTASGIVPQLERLAAEHRPA